MASLLTQLRNRKRQYQTETTSGNRFQQAYNKFHKEQYQPAYTKAYQYEPVVSSAYGQYRSAFDTAKRQYDQIYSQKQSAYENVLQQGRGLETRFNQASTSLSNYAAQNLTPFAQEYNRKVGQYQTAYNQAVAGAKGQYDATSEKLLRDYRVAADNRGRDYRSTKQFRSESWKRASDAAETALTSYNRDYATDRYVNRNTVFNPYVGGIQRFDSVERISDSTFRYQITGFSGQQSYDIKQAPDTFDKSLEFYISDQVKKYNFYYQTLQEGSQDLRGIPSYVNASWMKRKEAEISGWLKPETGLLARQRKHGETKRAEASTALTSVQALIGESDTAKSYYEDWVKTTEADYVKQQTAKELKAYTDFTATSLADYARPIAQKASADELAIANQYYSEVLQPKQQQYATFKQQNYDPAQTAYQNFLSSGAVSSARAEFENIAQDTGYVDRQIQPQLTQYQSTKTEFERLKAVYEGMEPTLSQLKTSYDESVEALGGMRSEISRLERSVEIDLDPRKSGRRVGQRQSILTRGSKRAGAAR